MKNKIALKLTVYFTAALLVFAFVMSGIFIMLFRDNTIEIYKIDLENRAIKISETLTSVMNGNFMQRNGYRAYINFINNNVNDDVWIVDENLEIITNGKGLHSQYLITELPANAEKIVELVFAGETAFSENFSTLLETPTLTVGTPIKYDGSVVGAVLVHSPVNGINTVLSKSILLLILSICISLLFAIILSAGFSVTFTKPLNKMNNTAIKLTAGDYTVKNNIKQKDEIGMLADNLDVLSERLYFSSLESEKSEKLRQDFVANISHELRTPITVIRGSLEALNDEVITDKIQIKNYYKQMLNETRGLQRLVGDLLDLSRLQNMDFKIEMTEVNLCDITSDVLRSAKSMAQAKNIEFIVENNLSDCTVTGDYGRLRQMIMTIADNAIKFSPQDGKIILTLSQDQGMLLSIKDEGPGIEEEDLPHIFDRFYKTKSPENISGTGLGLAIAKQIAIRHLAEISVVSTKDRGSEFSIRFRNDNNIKNK
ncbi:MAG: sensor histidine kinase [Eubacteriales bacterium]